MSPYPGSEDGPPVSRRLWRELRPRRTVWRNLADDAAAQLVDAAEAERVFIVGPRPGGNMAGLRAWSTPPGGLPPGWEPRQHYLDGNAPILRYHHAASRRDVELVRAAAWWGEGDYSIEQARMAWDRLGALVRGLFPGAVLLTTPATTGRELFVRSIPKGTEWPTLPPEVQDLIRETSGQGRIEVLDPRGADHLEQLVELDGRLMYAALAWGLPGGTVTRDNGTDYAGQLRARYHVRGIVPKDWPHRCACGAPGHAGIGLFPQREAGETHYPHEPGEMYSAWVDGAELRLAYLHGWSPVIEGRLVWSGYRGKGPLDRWAEQLASLYAHLDDEGTGALCRAGVRALVLHAIGAFQGRGSPVTFSLPIERADEMPAEVEDYRLEGTSIVWSEMRGPAWPALAHPEWCAAVWARARARLLSGPGETGALHIPAAEVVAFRTDAIYAQHAPPWRDDGRAGRFRVKSIRRGPLPWPRTHAELLAQREGR